jgi:hypothetical protein
VLQKLMGQEFFRVATAQGIAQIPQHGAEDDVGFKVAPFKQGGIAQGRYPMI